MSNEKQFIPKWHRELDLFSNIKPVLILDGNVLDVYQYPVEGTISKGSIIRLTDYLYYFFKDAGYKDIIFYDSLQGFYNNCETEMVQRFANLVNQKEYDGTIKAGFKGDSDSGAVKIIQKALNQNQEATVVVLSMAS